MTREASRDWAREGREEGRKGEGRGGQSKSGKGRGGRGGERGGNERERGDARESAQGEAAWGGRYLGREEAALFPPTVPLFDEVPTAPTATNSEATIC